MRLKFSISLIFVSFVYSSGWFIASEWVKAEIKVFADNVRMTNGDIKLNYESLERSGFPFALNWHIINPKIEMEFLDFNVQTLARKITLSVQPFDAQSIFAKSQKSTIFLINKERKLKLKTKLNASRFQFSVDPDNVVHSHFTTKNFSLYKAVTGNTDEEWREVFGTKNFSGNIQIPRNEKTIQHHTEHPFSFLMTDVSLPPKNILQVTRLDRLFGTINLRGKPGKFSPTDLITWRDNGGVLDIEKIQLDKGQYNLEFQGTLALDAALKPMGAGTVTFTGLDFFLAKQEQAGKLTKSQVRLAKLAIHLISKPSNKNGIKMTRVPITAQNGELRVGSFRLFDLPGFIR